MNPTICFTHLAPLIPHVQYPYLFLVIDYAFLICITHSTW
uniref:Uncharacterized protein n=1 Tax=Rhizophora mucronata TaxID=61149 RepID=A0A2P2KSA2_RHIMU